MLDLRLVQITAIPLMICDGKFFESQVLLMSVFCTSAVEVLSFCLVFKEHAIPGFVVYILYTKAGFAYRGSMPPCNCLGSGALLFVAGTTMNVEIL